MKQAYADNTHNVHKNQLDQYKRFCREGRLEIWGIESVARWLMFYREVKHLKRATIRAKFEAFKWGFALEHGYAIQVERGNDWYLLKRYIARLADDRVAKRHVGRAVLRKGVPDVLQRPDGVELAAWFAISHAALLRAAEAQALNWSFVQFKPSDPGVVRLELRAQDDAVFKTHTDSVKIEVVATGGPACPVRLLQAWYQQSGRPKRGAVFTVSESRARKGLQRMAAEVTGANATEFGLHSLRAGGATDMEADGASMSRIMLRGRWRSSAVLLYLRGGEELGLVLHAPAGAGRDVRGA